MIGVYRQGAEEKPSDDETVLLGGRILSAALKFEERISMGATRKQALASLKRGTEDIDSKLLTAFAVSKTPTSEDEAQLVGVNDLQVGMILQEEILNTRGNLIVSRGHEVTEGSRQRLRNYVEFGFLPQPEPEDEASEAA